MAITFPITLPSTPGPSSVEWLPDSAVSAARRPYNHQGFVYDWGGKIRSVKVTYPPMQLAEAKAWQAALYSLNGGTGTFYLSDTVGSAGLGTVSGTPLVNGSSQTGTDLITDGWGTGDNVYAGDWISIDNQLYTILEDVTESSGSMILTLWPEVSSPADNAAISYGADAKGVFRLDDWSSFRFSLSRLQEGITITATEAIADVVYDTQGLLLWYELDDEGIWADSVGNNDLTEYGTVSVDATGGPDSSGAAIFTGASGTDYLRLPTSLAITHPQEEFTVVFWSKWDSITGNQWPLTAADGNTGWYFESDGSDLRFQVGTSTVKSASISSALSTGTWHMIVGRITAYSVPGNVVINLQVDGTWGTQQVGALPFKTIAGGAFTLGHWWEFPTSVRRWSGGQMQRIGMWSRALSDADLTALYNSGNGTSYANYV